MLDSGGSKIALEHPHDAAAIASRLRGGPAASYLRDWVLGGIDGAVTTFAVVAGVTGAGLSPSIILILGIANLVADGFSMAAGNYSGVKAERDDIKRLIAMERKHISLAPEGEREEVRQIFIAKGFGGDDLEQAVALMTADEERWAQFMLQEEHGVASVSRSPLRAALVTFCAFAVCGLAPLAPFLLPATAAPMAVASVLTAATFFGIGAIKSKWSTVSWLRSGLETVAIGMIAAGLAFAAGKMLKTLAGV
ncbi:MAG: VIT1/CCC1 transporter family protein [Parvularculaceae bacterium]